MSDPRRPTHQSPVGTGADQPRGLRHHFPVGYHRPPHQKPLELEAIVSTTAGAAQPAGLGQQEQTVCRLCQQPRCLAEVSALLSVPLHLARSLIGGLVADGLVTVQRPEIRPDTIAPDTALIERVLTGLRR